MDEEPQRHYGLIGAIIIGVLVVAGLFAYQLDRSLFPGASLGDVLGAGFYDTAADHQALVVRPRDTGDLQLALRYLPDYRVVVVADLFDEAALGTIVALCIRSGRWR